MRSSTLEEMQALCEAAPTAAPDTISIFEKPRKAFLTPAEHADAHDHHHAESEKHAKVGMAHAYRASAASHAHAMGGHTDPELQKKIDYHETMAARHFAVADAHDHIRQTHSALAAAGRKAGIGDSTPIDGSNIRRVLRHAPALQQHITSAWDPKEAGAKSRALISSGITPEGVVLGPATYAQAVKHPVHAQAGQNTALYHALSAAHDADHRSGGD